MLNEQSLISHCAVVCRVAAMFHREQFEPREISSWPPRSLVSQLQMLLEWRPCRSVAFAIDVPAGVERVQDAKA